MLGGVLAGVTIAYNALVEKTEEYKRQIEQTHKDLAAKLKEMTSRTLGEIKDRMATTADAMVSHWKRVTSAIKEALQHKRQIEAGNNQIAQIQGGGNVAQMEHDIRMEIMNAEDESAKALIRAEGDVRLARERQKQAIETTTAKQSEAAQKLADAQELQAIANGNLDEAQAHVEEAAKNLADQETYLAKVYKTGSEEYKAGIKPA